MERSIAIISPSPLDVEFKHDYYLADKKIDWDPQEVSKSHDLILICGSLALKPFKLGLTFNEAKGCLLKQKYLVTVTPEEAKYKDKKKEALDLSIKMLKKLMKGESTENHVEHTIVDSDEAISAMLFDIAHSHAISIDTETSGLHAYVPDRFMASMGIATANHAWTIPLEHQQSPWKGNYKKQKEIIQNVKNFSSNCILVGHNGKFDTLWLWYCYNIWFAFDFDTMLAHYNLDENGLHGLDVLAEKYLGVNQYDIPVSEKHGFGDLKSHCHYLAMDVRYTYDLYVVLDQLLDKDPLTRTVFEEITMPASRCFARIENTGCYLNPKTLEESTKHWEDVLKTTEEKLKSYGDINWGSSKQVASMLFDKLKLPILDKTPAGSPSCSESVLKRLDHEVPKLILENRKASKFLSTFLKPWKELIRMTGDNTIHPSFKIHGTTTGRLSCLRKGTQIMIPGTTKNIEDIRPGDLVYCYDDNCNLTLKKVTWSGMTGIKKCIRLHFKDGIGRDTYLDLTPDHKVRLADGTYLESGKLPCGYINKKGGWSHCISVLSLYRHRHKDPQRNYLRVTHQDGYRIESNAVYDIMNGGDYEVIHHIDQNTLNDNPENLRGMTKLEHKILHYDMLNEEEKLGRLLKRIEGKIRKSVTRFDDVPDLMKTIGFNKTKELLHCSTGSLYRRVRNNHKFLYSEELPGEYEVYDLTVEDSHNFIANEICVHNCSDPNLQQIPRDVTIRSIVDAPEGWTLIEADFSQSELRLVSEYSGDVELRMCYQTGEDVHVKTCRSIFGIQNPTKEERKKAKAANFGLVYKCGWKTFMKMARDNYGVNFTEEEAKKTIKDFYRLYSEIPIWHKRVIKFVDKKGYVRSLIGRKRRLPDALLDPKNDDERARKASAERNAINSPVQSLGSDLNISALIALCKKFPNDEEVKFEGTIHDAIMLMARNDKVEEVCYWTKYYMEHAPILEKLQVKLHVPIIAEVETGPWGKGEVWKGKDL